jgi:hypothetical protein
MNPPSEVAICEDMQECSQKPSTGPFLKPDKSSQYHPIHFNIYQRLLLPSGLFPSGLRTNISNAFLFFPIRDTFPVYLIILINRQQY